ncbi:MAG TPA: nitroreductase family protein [Candidatus Limnocylindrales bacterium]|nr:nitroreductase family protein [Candidatus Limnocylindrales bacterium]
MTETRVDPREIVRPLIRTRQYRDFTDEPVEPEALDAIVDAARWSGSSQNTQPWRFIVIRNRDTLRTLAEAGLPQTRSLQTATAAIAIAMPDDKSRAVSHAFDEGRAAERILIAASMLGLGAGIAWIRGDVRDRAKQLLALPDDRFVRTLMSIGHPTDAARAPKSPRGQARLPREEVVFEERWGGR